VYNKNGRIGIYTPQERAAIIARYHEKRSHRNWNKKIRYNCRKSLADSRLRVKGRFVKRCGDTLEQQQQQQQPLPKKKPQQLINLLDYDDDEDDGNAAGTNLNDQDMPDVNDPDAGFAPTADQPYRRLRRSTVT
jgi:CCT motif